MVYNSLNSIALILKNNGGNINLNNISLFNLITIYNNLNLGQMITNNSLETLSNRIDLLQSSTPSVPSGSGVGDPYLYPILSEIPVKLPNKNAYYRLYENPKENIYINAHVDSANKEHQKRMLKFIKNKINLFENLNESDIICDGFFFNEFYINSNLNIFHINLVNKKITLSDNDYYNLKMERNCIYSCKDFNAYCNKLYISWVIRDTGKKYKIAILFFQNPHIENGIEIINCNYDKSIGLLIRNYKPKLMEIKNIYNCNKLIKKIRKKNKKYNIFQNKCIKKRGEKWVFNKKNRNNKKKIEIIK